MELDIINQIEHTTADMTVEADNVYITLSAVGDYTIVSAEANYIEEFYDDEEVMGFTIAQDGKTATVTLEYVSNAHPITLTGSTIDDSKALTIINEVNNSTASYTYDGVLITIKVKTTFRANSGLIDTAVNYTDINGEASIAYMKITNPEYGICVGEVSVIDLDKEYPVTITGRYVPAIKISWTVSNCKVDGYLPYYVEDGGLVEVKFIANVNTGFDINQPPTLLYVNADDSEVTKDFDISPDGKTCTISVEIYSYEAHGTVNAHPIETVGKTYGSINVYDVTIDNLDAFAKVRYYRDQMAGDIIDLGIYVNKIHRIHAIVPPLSDDVLRCGNYNTEIVVNQPETDRLHLDFGEVVLPYFNGDALDYQTSIRLMLPFRGFIEIPVSYVGKTMRLEYIINIVTGFGVAKLMFDGVPYMIEQTEPFTDIIYKTGNKDGDTIGTGMFSDMLLYGLEPYVLCEWYDSKNKGGVNNSVERGIIGDFKGFTSFRYVSTINNSQMLTSEQSIIYDLLRNGVYIE